MKIMTREDKSDKIDPTLYPINEFMRVCKHYTEGAKKYGRDNWKNATTEQVEAAKASLYRHMLSFIQGEEDEPHFESLVFNANLIEWHRNKERLIKEITND